MVDLEKVEKEIEGILNAEGVDNRLNIPDFILADFVMRSLDTLNITNNKSKKWHGETAEKFLNKMGDNDTIVPSCQCSTVEIAEAKSCGRMFVTDGSLGYIIRKGL